MNNYREECIMDSNELTLECQKSLFNMLESNDFESIILALNIIDTSIKPGIFINISTRKILPCGNMAFYSYIRRISKRLLYIIDHTDDIEWKQMLINNKDVLIRLSKY